MVLKGEAKVLQHRNLMKLYNMCFLLLRICVVIQTLRIARVRICAILLDAFMTLFQRIFRLPVFEEKNVLHFLLQPYGR